MSEKENTNIERVLYALGDQIIDIYRRKLVDGKTNASGLLGNSLSCIVQMEDGVYDLYISLQDYWKYVEYGRQPGKFPPMDAIKQWIQVKPIIPDARTGKIPTIDELTFLISRSIARSGIPAKNYLGSAIEGLKQDTTISEDITKVFQGKVDIIFKDF